MALAEALSEPGRHFNPDQVMLKGHKINIGQNGTHPHPPKRALITSMFRWACSVLRPLFMNGQVASVHAQITEASRACPRTPHPPKRALSTSMFRWACSVLRPLFMNGQVARVHAQITEASRAYGGKSASWITRGQHSSLQWLFRLVTYTLVSSCSLLQAFRLLAVARGSIPHWLIPTMGYHSWEWTC